MTESRKKTAVKKKASKPVTKTSKNTQKGRKKTASKAGKTGSTKVTAKKKAASVKKKTAVTKKKSIKAVSKKSSTLSPATKKKAVIKEKLPAKIQEKQVEAVEEDIDPKALERGDNPMSVVDHLHEFRSRILIALGTIIIFTIVGFFFSDYLLKFITQPFEETGQKLNIFKLTGGFVIRLKASVVAGLLVAVPIIAFQIWRYIMPAITQKDRNFSRISLIFAVFLFYGGMAFVFYLLLPFAIKMLLSFIGEDMLSTIGASDYMSFILMFSLAMGILFELPVVVLILTKIGILTPQFLIKKRKYAVIMIWIIAALITPADILSQVLVAVPLMFLYEISIIISKMIVIRKKRNELRG